MISRHFPCSDSSVVSQGTLDVVQVSFDAENSKQVMLFFTRSRQYENAKVAIKINPIHKPEEMILELKGVKETPTGSAFGGNFGFAVDAVTADGLMLQQAASMGDGSASPPPEPTYNKTPNAQRVEVVTQGNEKGEVLLTFRLTFPKPVMNG